MVEQEVVEQEVAEQEVVSVVELEVAEQEVVSVAELEVAELEVVLDPYLANPANCQKDSQKDSHNFRQDSSVDKKRRR